MIDFDCDVFVVCFGYFFGGGDDCVGDVGVVFFEWVVGDVDGVVVWFKCECDVVFCVVVGVSDYGDRCLVYDDVF